MKELVSKLDFGIRNFGLVVIFSLSITLVLVIFTPYGISVDGFSYLKSSEVLFSADFAAFYSWIREPGYPVFIRVLNDVGGLLLVVLVQGVLVTVGILATIVAVYRMLKIDHASWKTYLSAGLAIALVGGYASTLLQQSLLIPLFGLLLLVISRIITNRKVDRKTALMIFSLFVLSTAVAVFLGLAFGLALFLTLVLSGVLKLRLLISYSLLSLFALSLVAVPWYLVKSTFAPEGSPDAFSWASSATTNVISDFSPDKELSEALLTQLALINLGGDFAPTSGLPVSHENRIFGTPIYGPTNVCGRFLVHMEVDELWGKINTDYTSRCVPWPTLALVSGVNSISQFVFPLTGVALLTALVLAVRLAKKLRPVIFPAFIITLPYIVMDASISRYGALLVPLGAVLLVELLAPKTSLLDLHSSKVADSESEVKGSHRANS
jgi:hypothetical protein